jgi:hypothetical protein
MGSKRVDPLEKGVQQLEASASAAARKSQKQITTVLDETKAQAGKALSEAKEDLAAAASKATRT